MPTPPMEPGFMHEPFGKYVLVRKLAEGGMAEIFLAKQTGVEAGVEGFERNVVIKRMLPHISRQKRFVNMFLDEARLASRLQHANIIPIFEVGLFDDRYYICMEWLPGADLAWILQRAHERNVKLPVDVALRIIIAAARGLHHAHEFCGEEGKSLNIVHRDVSPSNLYVGYEGQVKVLDFGIAKAETRITSTQTGTVKGKTHYMAPEQSQAAPVDRRSDIYALGVTLYETLTVWPPFLRDSEQATLDAVMKNEYRPPRQRRAEIPNLVERACMKAMKLDPAERYATCAELADDLAAALESPLPPGADPGVGRWLREFCGEEEVAQRTRVPSLATLQKESAARAEADRGLAARVRRRLSSRGAIAVGAVALIALGGGGFALWRALSFDGPRGCGTVYGDRSPNAIHFGATLPLSEDGHLEDGQLRLLDADRLALDEINQRDGVAGRRFSLTVCDNAGDTARLKEQVSWLIEHEHAPALVTSWSSQTMAAVNLAQPKNVVVITADATSPELAAMPAATESGVRMLWRTAASDALQAELAAELLARDPAFAGAHRIGVLYQDDPYGQGWAGVLATRLPRLLPSVAVHAIQFPFRGDVGSAVEQLAAVKPDVTVLVSFPVDAVRVLNAAAHQPALTRKKGHRWFFADSIKEPSLFNGLEYPDELDGALGMEAVDGGGPEAASFQQRFSARYHRRFDDQTYTANRYDAMYLLALGAAWAGGSDGKGAITGGRIAEGLSHLSSGPRISLQPDTFTAAKAALAAHQSVDVVGASGDLDFDNAVGEARGDFGLWRVAGKRFEKVRRLGAPR
jgi:ABC-type branched-subunit amino acid transport system substrate-binding protein